MINFNLTNRRDNKFGSCIGSFDIELVDIGMTIRGVRLMCTDGKEWLAFPSKEYIDKEGQKRWMNHIIFHDAGKGEEFRNAVIEEALGNAIGVKDAPIPKEESW